MALTNPILLTDGTVMAQTTCTSEWHRLKPDIDGNYETGTWTTTAPMPAGYSPRFFASQVLPDGRLLIEGGEYDGAGCQDVESTNGAIYDPGTDIWTSVPPPPGWTRIGDASMILLADGRVLLSDCCSTKTALLDVKTLTWTEAGIGKADSNNEENWTLLPNGKVLTVDASDGSSPPTCNTNSELFNPRDLRWSGAGSTKHELSACAGSVPSGEAPTQILRPNGLVVAFGSTASLPAQNYPVWTAIYDTDESKWVSGPMMPRVNGVYYTMADAPAAVLPNGDVLVTMGPGAWATSSAFPSNALSYVFHGSREGFEKVGDVAGFAELSSYEMNFLVLPTGAIFGVETDFAATNLYTGACCSNDDWAPMVSWISDRRLNAGRTYTVYGRQLSGLTAGAAFGEDVTADTNFPLVRITNRASKHVFYARTSNFIRSVARDVMSRTNFDVPANAENGESSLVVVANGIASRPVSVFIDRD